MSLTVGTTLQNGSFVIEAILHQSDFGVTYQAANPALNRSIMLQSFNEALRQRSDFEQLRQKFLQEVLLFSKQPSETVQIVDCFEENGMPFVVLGANADQSIPPLSSWVEIPVEAPVEAPVEEISQPPTEASVLSVALATAFPDAPAAATVVAAPIAPPPRAEIKTEEVAIANAEELTPVSAAAVATSSPTLQSLPHLDDATNGSRNGVNVLVSEQGSKPRKWLPLMLMMTALITGFGGFGLGLALRFKPTPQADSASSVGSSWFGQEQSFPPQQDWPITETPNLYPPSSAFEQLYQPSPPVQESDSSSRAQPSTTGYIPPAQIALPRYQSAPPKIADYPPVAEPLPSAPATPADPSVPEATQPIIPLPQPVTPEALPETAPELNKPPAPSPQKAFADAPPIFRP